MQKPMPADTWANLFYPPPTHEYFKDSGRFPFERGAAAFSWQNAWWLAESSLLAYVKDVLKVEAILRAAGFDSVMQIGLTAPSTRGFFASRGGAAPFAIVAFRGTDRDDPNTTLTDLDTVPDARDGYTIHRGFGLALDQVWPELTGPLGNFLRPNPGAPVYFTGHSLGAALATIAVTRFSGTSTPLYTIGSPRVGDRAFTTAVLAKTNLVFRFVNSQDIVTQVPPGFHHAGLEKYIDRNGTIHDDPWEPERILDVTEGTIAHDGRTALGAIADPSDFLRNVVRNEPVPPDPPPYIVGNHSPARYPIRIWNYYSGQ